jgi:transcriptional regulator with XRE-family HTH domain
MKKRQQEEARYFRKVEGLSVRQITSRLGVSQSSVSKWVKDIKLTREQKQKLESQNPASSKFTGKRVVSEFNRVKAAENRALYQEKGKQECNIFNLHLAGCILYWAEGAKNKNSIKFTNTDSAMILLFKRFLNESLDVLDEEITVYCRSHILSPYTLSEVELHWLQLLGLNVTHLRKGSVETRIPKAKKVKYPYGICTIVVHNTALVQRIFGAIKQYGNIEDARLW